ncbi:MAG: hypothetical protein LUF32_00870 [Clostridiales bacterium]|nr:hypothetical protein [Clostridiales bacterium]
MEKKKKVRKYEFEGVTLNIPLYYDKKADMYIEAYPDFTETPVWTKDGHPIMFSGEDACPYSEWSEPGRCMDCGSCLHYTPVAHHTLIGVCRHAKRRRGSAGKEKDADKDGDEAEAGHGSDKIRNRIN